MTQKVEAVDWDIKTAIINILHVPKKIEKSISILRRDTEDTKEVKKTPNWPSRDEKYTAEH